MTPEDYPTICQWWEKHGALAVPEIFLPHGFMASEGEDELCCCFLYLDAFGKFSMVEYLTTNPRFSGQKRTLAAFKALLAHVEQLTLELGCGSVFSMIEPGSSEERIMSRLGYYTRPGKAHLMYAKILQRQEEPCPQSR